jgi:hypothetical protein
MAITKKELIEQLSSPNIPDDCEIHIDNITDDIFKDVTETYFSDHRPNGVYRFVLTVE